MSFKPYAMIESAPTDETLRRVRQVDLWAHTSLKTLPAEFSDPIFTPLFVSLGVTGAFSIGASTFTWASILSGIATTALTIGLQYLLMPKPPKPEDGHVPVRQAIPPRQWVVGRMRVAGAYMHWEAFGKYLTAVQAVAGHKVHGFNGKYWLHDDQIDALRTDNFVDGESGARYVGMVQILSRVGQNTETAYSEIIDVYSDPRVWSVNHRGDGQASMAMVCRSASADDQAQFYPYGAPQLTAEVDGTNCWDPRDTDQDPDHPGTWTWTRNSALILLWHECFNEFGHRRDYHKAILPVVDRWKDEIDICDEDVDLSAGGTQKRYWCSGFDSTDHDPKVGTNAILATCDGHLVERGDGALILTVGKFREELVETLTDADIIGHQVQYGVLPEEECNRLVPKFCYPDTKYTTTDTDFFEDTDAQLVAGRVLSQDGDYSWCTQWQQARRLGIRDWRRLQQNLKGSIDVRLSGLNAVYARWIQLDTPVRLPRLDGKIIENRHSVLAVTKGGYTMDFVKHPNNIDAWDPDTNEGNPPPVPPVPDHDDLVAPVINSVVAHIAGGVVTLKIKINNPDDDTLTLSVQYRLADDGTGSPGDWIERVFKKGLAPSGGYVTVVYPAVPHNEVLDVEAAWISSDNKYSEYSASKTVDTTI